MPMGEMTLSWCIYGLTRKHFSPIFCIRDSICSLTSAPHHFRDTFFSYIGTNNLLTEKTPGLIRTDSPGHSLDACLYMNVGSVKQPVRSRYATVDIGKLGWVISMQRWMGMHQQIYVRA